MDNGEEKEDEKRVRKIEPKKQDYMKKWAMNDTHLTNFSLLTLTLCATICVQVILLRSIALDCRLTGLIVIK